MQYDKISNMAGKEGKSLIKKIFNRGTQGAVSTGKFHEQRKEEILDALNPRRQFEEVGKGRADDWYSQVGREVSIEEARETELELKDALDDQVEAENTGVDDDSIRVRGLPPCKRVHDE